MRFCAIGLRKWKGKCEISEILAPLSENKAKVQAISKGKGTFSENFTHLEQKQDVTRQNVTSGLKSLFT